MKTIKIAFLERTGGVAAEVSLEETSEAPNKDKLMDEAQALAEQAQAIAVLMSKDKAIRSR